MAHLFVNLSGPCLVEVSMSVVAKCQSFLTVGLMMAIVPTPTICAQTKLPPVDIPLTAKVDAGRLVDVEFTGLDKVVLIPGDRVQVKFEGSSEFSAEFWSRRYTWEKTEQRGKKKII